MGRVELGPFAAMFDQMEKLAKDGSKEVLDAMAETLVTGLDQPLRRARTIMGEDGARSIGQPFMDAIEQYVRDKSDETFAALQDAARNVNIEIPIKIAEAQFQQAMDKSRDALNAAMTKTRDDAERQISDLIDSANRSIDQARQREGLSMAEQAATRGATAGFDAEAKRLQASRADRDFQTQTSRQLADLQAAHAQRIADLQKKGSADQSAAENESYQRAMATFGVQQGRTRSDREQRARDAAEDEALTTKRQAAIEGIQQAFEQRRRTMEAQFNTDALNLQVTRIRAQEAEALKQADARFQQESVDHLKQLADTVSLSTPIWKSLADVAKANFVDPVWQYWNQSMSQMTVPVGVGTGGAAIGPSSAINWKDQLPIYVPPEPEQDVILEMDSEVVGKVTMRRQMQRTQTLVSAGGGVYA
jgi:hypothetical protein